MFSKRPLFLALLTAVLLVMITCSSWAADPDAWAVDRNTNLVLTGDDSGDADPDVFTIDRHSDRGIGDEWENTDDLEGRWRVFLNWEMWWDAIFCWCPELKEANPFR